jgi:hypothetical protein
MCLHCLDRVTYENSWQINQQLDNGRSTFLCQCVLVRMDSIYISILLVNVVSFSLSPDDSHCY